jgi:single-stranded-DNA-specific exonuclease
VTTVDALLPPGTRLSLDLCAELGRLAPFGLGNPEPVLLAEACELGDLASVGEGKHLRFRVRRRDRDAGSAIAFGLGAQLDRYRRAGRYDVAFRLQENHWNGTVAPQLVVRRVFDEHERYEGVRAWLVAQWRLPAAERDAAAEAIFDELGLNDGAKRSLFESPTFLALLDEPPLAAAA